MLKEALQLDVRGTLTESLSFPHRERSNHGPHSTPQRSFESRVNKASWTLSIRHEDRHDAGPLNANECSYRRPFGTCRMAKRASHAASQWGGEAGGAVGDSTPAHALCKPLANQPKKTPPIWFQLHRTRVGPDLWETHTEQHFSALYPPPANSVFWPPDGIATQEVGGSVSIIVL